MRSTCQWQTDTGPCGRTAGVDPTLRIGNYFLTQPLCRTHLHECVQALVRLGFKADSVLHENHRRRAYLSASGALFSAADVRAWLTDPGRLSDDRNRRGRISTGDIEAYAQAH